MPPISFATLNDRHAVEGGDVLAPRFDADGLIPAIVTDASDGTVLMFAWMNAETLSLTIETGIAHFWSRSRRRIWKKGEESGNVLTVAQMLTDCDQDVLWLRCTISGKGVACHTGARSCFYRQVERSGQDQPPRLARVNW
ncbi:MAG: phosphoribosyl-AMP cyclohydrolase [Hyphomicrobiaceae bacterium]